MKGYYNKTDYLYVILKTDIMKKIIIGIILLLIASFFGYNYVMAAPKNIKTSKADYSISTTLFAEEFVKDLSFSEKKYTDKVVEINGGITEIEENGVTIDSKVFVQLESTKELKKGNQIKVKGLFIGYDELFELIKLDQGSIVE